MEPLFKIGPFSIYLFGLMIGIGVLVGLYFFLKEAKKRGYEDKVLLDGVIYSFIGGVIGARIIYILVYNPSYYLSNPLDVFLIHNGGLSIHGGLLGGLTVGFLFLKKKKLPIWKTLDIAAPFIILAQGISRIGCDVFGAPISSDAFWTINVDGEYFHPAQAYEFLLNYLLFGYLWLRLKSKHYHGQVFLHYLVGFLVIRGIVEFARINPMIIGPFSVSHLLSLIGIIFALFIMNYLKKKDPIKPVSVERYEIAKTWFYIWGLSIISILAYYLLQG